MFQIQMDLKARLKSKTFVITMIGAIIVFLKMANLDIIANFIPSNYAEIVTQAFSILTMLGIAVDTSTPGVSDQIANTTDTANSNVVINNTQLDTSVSTEDIEALKAQLASVQATNESLTATNNELNNTNASLTQSNNDLANNNANLTAQVQQIQSAINGVNGAAIV